MWSGQQYYRANPEINELMLSSPAFFANYLDVLAEQGFTLGRFRARGKR